MQIERTGAAWPDDSRRLDNVFRGSHLIGYGIILAVSSNSEFFFFCKRKYRDVRLPIV
jgi:hypothetical protein